MNYSTWTQWVIINETDEIITNAHTDPESAVNEAITIYGSRDKMRKQGLKCVLINEDNIILSHYEY